MIPMSLPDSLLKIHAIKLMHIYIRNTNKKIIQRRSATRFPTDRLYRKNACIRPQRLDSDIWSLYVSLVLVCSPHSVGVFNKRH